MHYGIKYFLSKDHYNAPRNKLRRWFFGYNGPLDKLTPFLRKHKALVRELESELSMKCLSGSAFYVCSRTRDANQYYYTLQVRGWHVTYTRTQYKLPDDSNANLFMHCVVGALSDAPYVDPVPKTIILFSGWCFTKKALDKVHNLIMNNPDFEWIHDDLYCNN